MLFFISLILLAALALALWAIPGCPAWVTVSLMAALAADLGMIYRGYIRPMKTISNGFDLLRGQDFGSRLAKVGQHDADRLVEMFNTMMERLKQERLRLHEQNTFLGLLIEASPMAIVIYDFDGKPTMTNPAAKRIITSELQTEIEKIAAGSTETVRLGDNSIYKVSRLWFMEMGFRRPFVLVESLTDEVYRAEKAAYGKVIRMIAHEVNNTMAGVKSMLETLGEIFADDSTLRELAESCSERCTGMSRFITAYADVVKIPDPQTSLRDINECLRRQLPFLEALAPEGISVTLHPSDAPAWAEIDSVLFEQAVVNIVKNAVESIAPMQGEVNITVTASPTTIEITDNGKGISPDIAGKLFTPFLSTKPGGQGIGLLCISEILRRHGCTFSLATSPTDGLTRFTIKFYRQKK